jgi:putative transcriptional regulator
MVGRCWQTNAGTLNFCPLNVSWSAGKLTLRKFKVESNPMPAISAQEVMGVREQLHLSRPEFARYLRTNPRTRENWEHGRAKPNAQAALLILMVAQYPDMVQRLEAV